MAQTHPTPSLTTQRRYDIDWLRSTAFIVLIFYHIGMYYVDDWGWHVKSQYLSTALQYPMLLINQWRMPLVFLISGFALAIVEPKFSTARLLRLRFTRVFIPLVVGMYLIVPPQGYFEAGQQLGYSDGYWPFWLEYIQPNSTLLPTMQYSDLGLLTWNHLWYLAYLWAYTLVYALLKPLLTKISTAQIPLSLSSAGILLAPIGLLTTYGLTLKPLFPRSHALFDDWYNHALYFTIFIIGYALAKSPHTQLIVQTYRRVWLVMAIIGSAGLAALHANSISAPHNTVIQFWLSTNLWCCLLTLLGYAAAKLNHPNPKLGYFNQAILPWYILHQTAIIVIAMTIRPWQLGGALEFVVITIGTFAACAGLYAMIRRITFLRVLFGMKLAQR